MVVLRTRFSKRKLFLMVGKALLTAVNNVGKSGFHDSGTRANPQRVTMNWYGQLTDVERSQPYGFETYPVAGDDTTAKAILLSPDGSRSNAFVVMVQDDEYRPTDLTEGASCQYDNNDGRHTIAGGKHAIGNKDTGKEFLAMMDDHLTEIITSLTFIRDTITFSNGGGPTGPPSNAALITPRITALEAIQTDLQSIKGTI